MNPKPSLTHGDLILAVSSYSKSGREYVAAAADTLNSGTPDQQYEAANAAALAADAERLDAARRLAKQPTTSSFERIPTELQPRGLKRRFRV